MKKLLVVVDYQNDFVDGASGFDTAISIEEHIIEQIKLFKSNNDDVVYTLDTHDENYLSSEEGKNLPIPHCIKGQKGHELTPRLKELLKDDIGFLKNTFGSVDLMNYLLNKNYQEVVLLGLVSNMCVLANAIIAKTSLPNAHIVVDALGSDSFNRELQEKAYEVLNTIHIEIRR